MSWARNVFVKNAKLYELVLEGMWEKGVVDAMAISSLLQERGMNECRILDVPCGIGRVGVPLAQLGFSVTGLDYSPHLVNVAREIAKRYRVATKVSFIQGNMLQIGSRVKAGSFDCAINVFTSIGYGSEGDDTKFFRALRRAVRRGGLFLVSGLRNRDYILRNPSQNLYEESDRLLILDRYEFDFMKSREKGSWRFYLRVGSVLKWAGEFPIDIRIYSPHELARMLDVTGWHVTAVHESFTSRRPFTPESPVYSLIAEAV